MAGIASSEVRGIYPLVDAAALDRWEVDPAVAARVIAELPITVLQLRCKGEGGRQFEFVARWQRELARHAPRVRVMVNDRVDVALLFAGAGVHVGQDDLPLSQCRKLLGRERLLGLSTHHPEQVVTAQGGEGSPDYLGFGPVFATTTKPDAAAVQGIDGLRAAVLASRLPVVAIGGIGLEQLPAVAATGAAAAAMISGWLAADWPHRLARACELWELNHCQSTLHQSIN